MPMSDNNQVILVTGEPRSGTSMQMAFLRSQGISITGDKYPRLNNIDLDTKQGKERFERAKRLNPNGFWEIDGTVIHGLQSVPDKWNNQAIKIVSSGAYPRWDNGRQYGTPPECYEKAILCTRNPRSVAKSQQDLFMGVEVAGGDGWDSPRLIINPEQYIHRTGDFLIWLADQPQEIKDKFHIVDFDEMLSDPEAVQKKITKHLDIKYQSNNIVEPRLNRSEKQEWPEKKKDVGRLADRLYKLTLDRDWDGILAWEADREDITHYQQLERVKWADTEWETYRIISPHLWRSLESNRKNIRDKLCKSSEFHNYTKSKYYEKTEEIYTVERPPDIGDLTRNKVFCTHPDYRGVMTHEQFRGLWTQWGRK